MYSGVWRCQFCAKFLAKYQYVVCFEAISDTNPEGEFAVDGRTDVIRTHVRTDRYEFYHYGSMYEHPLRRRRNNGYSFRWRRFVYGYIRKNKKKGPPQKRFHCFVGDCNHSLATKSQLDNHLRTEHSRHLKTKQKKHAKKKTKNTPVQRSNLGAFLPEFSTYVRP